MSDSSVRLVILGALLLHGISHGGALAALAWIGARPGSDTGSWQAARSWLAAGLPAGVESVQGDLLLPLTLPAALDGIDTAYYASSEGRRRCARSSIPTVSC